MNTRPMILVVDDVPANLMAMKTVLREVEADLVTAESGMEALSAVLEHDFSLILLDVQMPEMDGFEVAEIIRQNPDYEHIPIIFVTAAYRELQHQIRGYSLGAFDYVEKPVNRELMVSKVGVFLELGKARADQKRLLGQLEVEIQERMKIEAELLRLSLTDALTGLPNRRSFMERAEAEFRGSRRYGLSTSVAMIDIDHFKKVNDSLGHAAGDDVLVALGRVIQERFRLSDAIGRLGGEEFAVMFTSTDARAVLDAVDEFRSSIEQLEIGTSAGLVKVTVSIGLTGVRESDESFAEVLNRADGLLYESKNAGRNRVTAD